MLNWADIPYTLPLILAGIASLALAFYAAQHSQLRGARPFFWFCLAVAEFALTYPAEIISPDLGTKLFWAKIEYLGIASGPAFWMVFALTYTRRDRWLRPQIWIPVSLIPITTVVLVLTN